MEKREQGQNWGNPAKEILLHADGTVLNEAASSVKQGGVGKETEITEALNHIKGTVPNKEGKELE